MKKGLLFLVTVILFAGIFVSVVACQSPLKSTDDNSIPETKLADWKKLRDLVNQYNTCRADAEQRNLLIVQNGFRDLTVLHSSNKIGDESLYYVGRIYYDIRDYHDARVTFNRHKEFYPNSDFAPTIARLEAEMDKDSAKYKEWLDQTRTTTTAY